MKKVLLTYLDKEAAISAALFFRKYKDLELKITSARRLPDTLMGLGKRYFNSEIIILGLGFYERLQDTKNALKFLISKENQIVWVNSVNDLRSIKKEFPSIIFIEHNHSILDNTIQFLKMENQAADLLAVFDNYECPENIMIESAIYRAINFDDFDIYPSVIKELAFGEVSYDEKENVRQFRNYFSKMLIGKSSKIKELRKIIKKIGQDNFCKVLILGESGTGKNLVAYLLHYISKQKNKPFFTLSCANFSENLLDSELFGHEKGAFTGAIRSKRGLVELAGEGTLFLDEIGEMPLSIQAKFLRFIQEGKFIRLGGQEEIFCHPRIITATNRNLLKMVKEGKFREDLYYRISETIIETPPLRERKEDIPLIGNNILYHICQKRGAPLKRLRKKHIKALEKYDWPGNIRELENVLTQAFVLDDWDFKLKHQEHITEKREELEIKPLKEVENEYILKVYHHFNKNKKKTAYALDIAINTLRARLKEMGEDK